MATVNPYLTFNGNCEEAFSLYKSIFGGNFQYLGKFKDMPPQEGFDPITEAEGDKIMHISLPIGKETILMGSDCPKAYGPSIIGTNFSVSLKTDSKEEADVLFNGLSTGGKVTMPMNTTFWGSYFGMLVDKFDIQWMVSFEQNKS